MTTGFRDYYDVLSVPRNANQNQIRKAFRKLARKFHPDVAEDKSTAEEKFKEVNEAYEVLGDPEKRKKYDTLGKDWNREAGPGAWGYSSPGGQEANYEHQFTGTGFSDFFEQLFGAHAQSHGSPFRQSSTSSRTGPIRGSDIDADILVSLDDIWNGAERALQLREINRSTGTASIKNIRIRIPRGISEGQLIRCAKQGEPGLNGGSAGDLFLHVRLERHPDYRIDGADLFYDLRLAPWEAALGAVVPVKSPHGEVNIKVPPHSESDTELRIRGKGLPVGTSGQFGNLYACLKITMPTTLNEQEKSAWEKLAEVSAFNPRTT